tara:strand:+ start:1524 stop:2714 length:1191 start_codon:yes stop_codon:yes gene_type:complete
LNIKDAIVKNTTLSRLLKICNDEKFGRVYVVGGFIRDYFFDVQCKDIDISVEKNSLLLAKKITNMFNGKLENSKFSTHSIYFKHFRIDIANMRKETYIRPGNLPKIKLTNYIRDDLIRRDFTINSLAASLNSRDLGEIIDPLDGLLDINNQILRNNHSLSFYDDPTRIFRAIKYSNKLSLKIDSKTEKQLYEHKKFIKNLSSRRILNELNILLEDDFHLNFKKLSKYKIMTEIENNFIPFTDKISSYKKLPLSKLQKIYLLTKNIDKMVAENLYTKSPEFFEWSNGIKLNNKYKKIHFNKYTSSRNLHLFLKDLPREFLLFMELSENRDYVKKQLSSYLKKLSKIKLFINGSDLLDIGYKKGPIIGNILNQILLKKISGEIKTKSDEINFAKMKMR